MARCFISKDIMKIMIVDDDKCLLEMLEEILVDQGHEVFSFDNAVDALNKSREEAPEIIFLDFYMPKHDGVWFMENVSISKATKIVLITGRVDRNVINRMFSMGVSGYLIKPFGEEDILQQLDFHAGNTTGFFMEETTRESGIRCEG